MRKLLLVLLTMAVLALAPPAAADPPTAGSIEETFEDVNPCTGLIHEVTITGTFFEHSHDGRIIVITERTITTRSDRVCWPRNRLLCRQRAGRESQSYRYPDQSRW
jgi:hypothetical protein